MLDEHHATRPPTERDADRRTIRRVAAFGAATLAVTALATAGVAQTAGAARDASAPVGAITLGLPAGVGATPSADPAPTRPQLKISLAYQRTGRDLALTINFDGQVHTPYSIKKNKLVRFPTPAGRSIGLGEELSWGDGTNADVPAAKQRCPQGTEKKVLHPVKDSYTVTKSYTEPGTYTVDYSYFACGLTGGEISGAFDIDVP